MTILEINDFWAGALTTAFGAIIVMIWDYYNIHKDTIDRETNILNAVDYEITKNIEFATSNIGILLNDVIVRKKDREVVTPLTPFRNEIWTLIKINISKKFLENGKVTDIVTISILIDQINQVISSRENYRTNIYTDVKIYNFKMSLYDNDLIEKISLLSDLLIKLRNKLNENNIVIRADEAGAYYCVREAMKNR